jgi:hypothetical protein
MFHSKITLSSLGYNICYLPSVFRSAKTYGLKIIPTFLLFLLKERKVLLESVLKEEEDQTTTL